MLESGLAKDLRARDGGFGAYASFQYFSGNDWTTIQGISGNWSERFSPREGRNLALALARAEVGASYGTWRAGYLHRRDVTIETNRDVIDLLYYQRNNLPIPVGRTFSLHFEAEALDVEGPRIAKTFEFNWSESASLRVGVAVASLQGSKVRSSRVGGEVTATGPGTFALEAQWLDIYTRKTYLFLTPGAPSGKGHSLDAAIDFDWGDGNRAWLSIEDLYARMSWREVPSTEARATTNTATRDAQGFIVYLPAVAGQNRRREFTQRLDPKTSLGYAKSIGRGTVAAKAFFLRGFAIPSASFDYRLADHWRVGIERDFRFDTVSLSLSWRGVSVSLASDRGRIAQARALGVAMQFSHAF